MTIALAVKVHDGVVLASDSASSLIKKKPDGEVVVWKVFNNANKISNLRKGLPVGGITWGAGSIGAASISTLAKDLRQEFAHGTDDLALDVSAYQLKDVAERVRDFLVGKIREAKEDDPNVVIGELGFMVVGYSVPGDQPEVWEFFLRDGTCINFRQTHPQVSTGVTWAGSGGEAIQRLVFGVGSGMPDVLRDLSLIHI